MDGQHVDYREGKDPNYPRKLLGLRKFDSPLVLKRGYIQGHHDDGLVHADPERRPQSQV